MFALAMGAGRRFAPTQVDEVHARRAVPWTRAVFGAAGEGIDDSKERPESFRSRANRTAISAPAVGQAQRAGPVAAVLRRWGGVQRLRPSSPLPFRGEGKGRQPDATASANLSVIARLPREAREVLRAA